MKNSVKFFLSGIAAATLVFVALAFTNAKQEENKEYLVVRIMEDAQWDKLIVQVCDKNGKVEAFEEKLEKTKNGIFGNLDATHTLKFTSVINKYAQKGFKLISNSSSTSLNLTNETSTLIFEK